ncbi:MAG: hypothetical protein AB1576_04660 [Bacillota bacterium]
MSKRLRVCPQCGEAAVKPIIYGLPGPDLIEAENAGKVRLGGCLDCSDLPDYVCDHCGLKWKGKVSTKDYHDIEQLRASTTIWPGPRYCVEVDFVHARVSWNKSNMYFLEDEKEKNLNKEEMNAFLDGLRRCDLLDWRGHYYWPALDGVGWEVEIRFADAVMTKTGSNDYPAEWEGFCCLVRGLAGGTFQ